MNKKIGLFWLRNDFRTSKNEGLIEATKNHDEVVVFYLYKKNNFLEQEAQKWWLNKSLFKFPKDLSNLNINLQILQIEILQNFFDKLVMNKDFSIYWNKVYEPDYLKFDNYLKKNLNDKKINYKICKGIHLMK